MKHQTEPVLNATKPYTYKCKHCGKVMEWHDWMNLVQKNPNCVTPPPPGEE